MVQNARSSQPPARNKADGSASITINGGTAHMNQWFPYGGSAGMQQRSLPDFIPFGLPMPPDAVHGLSIEARSQGPSWNAGFEFCRGQVALSPDHGINGALAADIVHIGQPGRKNIPSVTMIMVVSESNRRSWQPR